MFYFFIKINLQKYWNATLEPLRTIQCEEPLTPLHKLLPAMVLGYSFTEIVHNAKHVGEKQLLFHGIIMAAVMSFVCVTSVQHTITPMLLMEVCNVKDKVLTIFLFKNFLVCSQYQNIAIS